MCLILESNVCVVVCYSRRVRCAYAFSTIQDFVKCVLFHKYACVISERDIRVRYQPELLNLSSEICSLCTMCCSSDSEASRVLAREVRGPAVARCDELAC